MQISAPAKVNLSLRVIRRREDGFHEIETLMAPISLADELALERGAPAQVSFSSAMTGPCRVETTISSSRPPAAFFEKTGIPGDVSIRLEKKIPHGAGLGGGSSDAASTLDGFERIISIGLVSGSTGDARRRNWVGHSFFPF